MGSRPGGPHVLYLIDSLVPAGAERSLAAMAPGLIERGLRLDVAYFRDAPGVQGELRSAGAGLYCLGEGSRVQRLNRATALAESLRPDLIHTTLFEADIAGRLAGLRTRTPVVSSLVNEIYGRQHVNDPRIRTWRLRGAQAYDALTARSVVRWHAVAGYIADVMARRLLIRRDRIDVVHRGRDPRALGVRSPERTAEARARLGVTDGTRLVLAAARHEHQKGLDVLIEAWPQVVGAVPHARLIVAGREGNETAALEAAIERLSVSDSVSLLGVRSDVPDLMCAADAFVLPSRFEGLPGILLEALALEAPTVATDIPPVREVVGDREIAALVPVGDARTLGKQIVEVLGRAAHERTAPGRRLFLEGFTVGAVVDGMSDFYERALATSKSGVLMQSRLVRLHHSRTAQKT